MALNAQYVTTSDLESWVFVDKDTGLALAGGILTFYDANDQITPRDVYTLTGTYENPTYVSLGNVLILSAVGTPEDNSGNNIVIYYKAYDEDGVPTPYYVTCQNSAGVPQFSRLVWPNVTAANSPTPSSGASAQNQIANPTFTNNFLNAGLSATYTVSGATSQLFSFAPEWNFYISGTGTVTVQVIPVAGNQDIITSPPYLLDIAVSEGVTSCFLTQRFFKNSGLWTSTTNQSLYLYGSFVAKNVFGGTSGIDMYYAESDGVNEITPVRIIAGSFGATYQPVNGFTADPIPSSTNPDTGLNGYVDIYLSFNPNTHVQVTSIQVIPSVDTPVTVAAPDLNSSNRDEALQGSYYIPRLIQKEVESFLVGWDFPVNPFQFGSSGTVVPQGTATQSQCYIADQTIALAATNNVTWGIDAETGGLTFSTIGTNDAFYIMQYLSGDEVTNMAISKLAVNVYAATGGGTATPFGMQIYLYSGTNAAAIPTLPTALVTVNPDGTVGAPPSGWSLIGRNGLPTAQATVNSNPGRDYGFTGWQLTNAQAMNHHKFAIVVTFTYAAAPTLLSISSISVTPGDLPCRPALKTESATLADCQYYYESYGPILKIQSTNVQSNVANTYIMSASSFDLQFNTIKRTNPVMAIGVVTYDFYSNGSPTAPGSTGSVNFNKWNAFGLNTKGVNYGPSGTAPTIATGVFGATAVVSGDIHFSYTADARLGIV